MLSPGNETVSKTNAALALEKLLVKKAQTELVVVIKSEAFLIEEYLFRVIG